MVNTVEVRGAQFIPEQDIKATCGAEEGIEYFDYELRAIEDCLMSTGVFETVALSREGDTLVIDVQELDTRPGRIDATLAYVSQDGLTGSLSYERYNLFDRTYGAANLEYGEEVQRYSLNLYRTEAFNRNFDMGFELSGGRDDYDDRSYTHESHRIETYLAWAMSPSTKLEAGIGYRDHRLYDLEPTASALLVREQTDGISAPYVRLGLRHEQTAEARDDRFVAAIDVRDEPVRLAYVVRAVTPGEFVMPGVNAEDMYRPSVFARSTPGRITIDTVNAATGGQR